MANSRRQLRTGFTIVELILVIVVIAILAAITIVAYRGVQKNAVESTLQADLSNSAKVLELNRSSNNGGYPLNIASINDGKGLSKSKSTTYTYSSDGTTYCLQASNDQSGAESYYIAPNAKVQKGVCSSGGGSECEPGHGNCEGDGDGEYPGPPISSFVQCPVQSSHNSVGWYSPPASQIPYFWVDDGYGSNRIVNDLSSAGTFVYGDGPGIITVMYENTLGLKSTGTTKSFTWYANDCYD